MRASRLLTILLLLQSRGRMTATQLAAHLEVSVRTVYRDIDSLSAAGVPVYADRGPAGGYRVLDGYRTRLTGLTAAEAETLFLAGMPGPAAELGLGTVLAAAELKLIAALPPELRGRAERIRQRFHLDAPGWFKDTDQVPHLAAIADAVWTQHRIRVRYRRWDNSEVDRELEPLGLVLKAGRWYLAADSGGAVRSYRINRVLALRPTGDPFDRPAGFDLARFWASTTEHVRETLYRADATVRLSPRGVRMSFLLGDVAHRAVRAHPHPPEADGWVRVVIPMETAEHAVRALLQLGADAEVLAPQEVRDRLATTVRALAATYLTAPDPS